MTRPAAAARAARPIVYCAAETGCQYITCYAPDTCQHVLDAVPGGVVGDATTNATAWTDCQQAQCVDECPAAE